MPVVADFMNELNDPDNLLRHFYILIGGGAGAAPPNGQAAVRRFTVDDRNMNATGFTTGISGLRGVTKQRPVVGVTLQPGLPAGAPAANEFDAYYIPMVQTADVANNSSHYTLPTTGQPTLIVRRQMI